MIVEEIPLAIVEEKPLRPSDATPAALSAEDRTVPARAVKAAASESPEWAQAYLALEALRGTLDGLGLLKGQPAVAHDFVAVLAALDAVRGYENVAPYWMAQLARLSEKRPPQASRSGSIYLHQLTGRDPD